MEIIFIIQINVTVVWFIEQFGDISFIFCSNICDVFAEVSY